MCVGKIENLIAFPFAGHFFPPILEAEYLHELLGHKVGPLRGPVVLLNVDEEAQEERVHGHGVHGKEACGYEVGA